MAALKALSMRALQRRSRVARSTSEAAWAAYCDALEPGVEMDAVLEECTDVARIRHGVPEAFSTNDCRALKSALLWCTKVELTTATGQFAWANSENRCSDEHLTLDDHYQAMVEERDGNELYEGQGCGKTVAEALSRALLAMYSPIDGEAD